MYTTIGGQRVGVGRQSGGGGARIIPTSLAFGKSPGPAQEINIRPFIFCARKGILIAVETTERFHSLFFWKMGLFVSVWTYI